MEELENQFVDGKIWFFKKESSIATLSKEVEYARQQDGFPPVNIVIRCLLIFWTGDYPAQSEVQKFI